LSLRGSCTRSDPSSATRVRAATCSNEGLAELGVIGVPGASELPSFVAVEIAKDMPPLPAPVAEANAAAVNGAPRRRRGKRAGLIEIELAGGRRVRWFGRSGRRCGGIGTRSRRAGAAMIPVPSGVRAWLAVGRTDMRNYAERTIMWSPRRRCYRCRGFRGGITSHNSLVGRRCSAWRSACRALGNGRA